MSAGSIHLNSSSNFYNLLINGNSGVVVYSNLLINNNLNIYSGYLVVGYIDVINNVSISGNLVMEDAFDILNVGGYLIWNSGCSADYVTNGTINVSGDWYFDNGTDAQLGTGNTANFVGSGNSVIYCDDDDACFGNLTIAKDDASDIVEIPTTNTVRVAGDLNISEGKLYTAQNTGLEIGTAFTIDNGGTFIASGSVSDDALITKHDTDPYALNVESGGTIGGSYATFEYMDANGINIKDGALISTVYPFNNCTFKNGASGGTLLTIDNSQTLTIDGAEFTAGSRDATYNVTKNVDAGEITFTSSGGSFDGPDYEDDDYDRIDWSGFTAPTVTTDEITEIEQTTATGGGNVTADGGSSVTARGVCWSTSSSPTTADDHTTDGSGTGTFVSSLTGLDPATLYYVRAYATNAVGTSYGNEVSFTTSEATPPDAPANLTIEISGSDVVLNWDAVSGADSYSVYSSDDPHEDVSLWNLEQSGIAGTTWSEAIPASPKFYYVTSISGSISVKLTK